MGHAFDKDGSIRCVCCGRRAGELGANGAREWLRQDAGLGLGVCSDCPEWLQSWDRGHRDVSQRARLGDSDSPGSDAFLALEQLVQKARLPSFSSVLLEVYDLLSNDTAGAEEIAPLLETDSALVARTLRLANSAFYGSAREVSIVKEALVLIGPFDLWWLLFTSEVKTLFYGIDQRLIDMEAFWRHSLQVASTSRVMSARAHCGESREMFVSGLLHDVGKLLLLQQKPIEYGVLLQRVQQGETLHEVEASVFGFTHADAGGRLLERWQLPDRLVEAVRRHHRRSDVLDQASLVAHADRLVHQIESEPDAISEAERTIAEESLRLYQRMVKLVLP